MSVTTEITDRNVGVVWLRTELSVREVWGLILGLVKSNAVTNDLPPLRRFHVIQALSCATRYTLRRNNSCIMKVVFLLLVKFNS